MRQTRRSNYASARGGSIPRAMGRWLSYEASWRKSLVGSSASRRSALSPCSLTPRALRCLGLPSGSFSRSLLVRFNSLTAWSMIWYVYLFHNCHGRCDPPTCVYKYLPTKLSVLRLSHNNIIAQDEYRLDLIVYLYPIICLHYLRFQCCTMKLMIALPWLVSSAVLISNLGNCK